MNGRLTSARRTREGFSDRPRRAADAPAALGAGRATTGPGTGNRPAVRYPLAPKGADKPARGALPTRPRGGNKQLKRAFFLAAFASLAHPPSRIYYDRKRAAGKRHNAALICRARRRVDVLFAMLRDRTPYQTRPSEHALAA